MIDKVPDFPEYYLMLMYGGAGILGLISCFFGFKLFKVLIVAIMAVTGAATLAWLGFHYGDEPVLWSAGGLLIGAALGGILALFFYSVAVATLGALFVASSLLPWVQPYEVWIQWTVLGVASFIAALVAGMLTNLTIQLGSAMIGAMMLVHSILFFVTGQTVHEAVQGEEGWTLYLNLDLTTASVAVGLGILGFLVQRRAAK